MDLDAFVTAHRAEWDRLRYLASRHRGSLTPAEVDEIVALYHRAARRCPHCKAWITAKATFCSECGGETRPAPLPEALRTGW